VSLLRLRLIYAVAGSQDARRRDSARPGSWGGH
jgi:hypothetical protein